MAKKAPPGRILPLVALRNMVMFPGVVTNLQVGRRRSLNAVERAVEGDRRLALVAQRDLRVEEPSPEDLYDVGVVSEITAVGEQPLSGIKVVVASGAQRCRIVEWVQQMPHIAVRVEAFPGTQEEVPGELYNRVKQLYGTGAEGETKLQLLEALPASADLDYLIAFELDLPVEDKQQLLAEPSRLNRYRMLVPVLETEGRIATVGQRIWRRTRRQVAEQDKQQYLRDRKENIERELAELTGRGQDLLETRRRIQEAGLPAEAQQEAERELARLGRMTPGQPEYAVADDFLDWLAALPWNKSTDAVVDVERAHQVLDRDHYDRREVKERILEYLSVHKLSPKREGALLCLVGAPGVGKTSLGRSIAEATERKFYRVSLGGIRDEAEIRGHRRTYLGARPGCVMRALRSIGVNNPVILLDEIDKLGGGLRGDPASALLEVLDPEYNATFVDNYISVPFDLSHIMFIGTGNTADTIPSALLDRLEVIELPGYSTEEKIAIARQYLVPKQLHASGLGEPWLEIDEEAIEWLVERYTREAGVRSLEREIASIFRKLAREYVGGKYSFRVLDKDRVLDLLGPPPYHPERSEKLGRPGVCPTLAVSPSGGRLLLVEVTRVAGTGKLIVTGRAGAALRESANLALSFWRSRAEHFGLDSGLLEKADFHVHFPGGGVPKEGTAAGLPVALGFASLMRDAPLPEGTAAMGEITLHGRVLQVKLLAERLAAAERAGITHILIPERNRSDVESERDRELPADLRITYVSEVKQAVDAVLPAKHGARPASGR